MIPLLITLFLACSQECPSTAPVLRSVSEDPPADVIESDPVPDSGTATESDPVPCTLVAWYEDCDADGSGVSPTTLEYAAVIACEAPTGECAWVSVAGDCDDTDSATRPFAVEICDGRDNDCDSYIEGGPC